MNANARSRGCLILSALAALIVLSLNCGGSHDPSATTSERAAAGTATAAETRTASAPGVTADTITLGATVPLSGAAANTSAIMKVTEAYIQKVNDAGGVNGRKIRLLVEDDAYSPANTPPLTKKLVEQDHVLGIVGSLGTATHSTVVDYLNEQKVPDLFIDSGAGKWGDYQKYPWSMGFFPAYPDEARAYGKYVAQTWPGQKLGLLYQNDDFGRDYLAYRETIGAANPTVDEETFEATAVDVNAQITNLRAKGVQVLLLAAFPKLAGLALRAAADQNWHPHILLASVAADSTLFGLAGDPRNADGVITAGYYQQYDSGDPSIEPVRALVAKYVPQVQLSNYTVLGYMFGQVIVETLKRAGANPTRQSLLAAAESFDHYPVAQLLPGITVSTSKANHHPIRCIKLVATMGGRYSFFGDAICAA